MVSVAKVGACWAMGLAIVLAGVTPAANAVARSLPVRGCPADFSTLPPVAPAHHAHVPTDVTRPPGYRPTRGVALYGVASDSVRTRGNKLGYEALAAPTGYACSGVGGWEDDISFATFRSRTNRSHAVTARFNFGQGGFAALCAYLDAAGRVHAARRVAHLFRETLRQCRQQTPDLPKPAHARGVRLSTRHAAPFAVVIRAPAGSETTWGPITRDGTFQRGHRTTTPTVSVAIVKYISLRRFVSPQSLDCSLPSARHSTCVVAARAFVSETMITSFGWNPSAAARAGRSVARTLG
jgi:hypothetical protein